MTNIKFNYLYRDASNYKNFGSITLNNPNGLTFDEIEAAIKSLLIDGEYFNAQDWNIPPLFFENTNEDDHSWHEYESIEATSEIASTEIENFLSVVKARQN